MVFGPDKLPEIGAKLGNGMRELRQLSREISAGVNTITRTDGRAAQAVR